MNGESMHELIQQYMDKSMPPEKKARFEVQLEADPILQQEYALYRDIESELKNNSLKNFKSDLSSVSEDYHKSLEGLEDQPKVVTLNKKRYTVAASLLILICVGLWGLSQNNTPSPIGYYDFDEIHSKETRSALSDASPIATQKKQIIALLRNNNYRQVIGLLDRNTTDDSLNLLLGHAFLLEGISENSKNPNSILDAIRIVLPLTRNQNLDIKYESEWLLLLSYSKSPQHQSDYKKLLKSILANADHSFYNKAKKIQNNIGE